MSLRRYRRRGGGCIVRTVNNGGTANDIQISMPGWYSSVGKPAPFGFFYDPDVGTPSAEFNVPVTRVWKSRSTSDASFYTLSGDNSILDEYLLGADLLTSGTYTLFWWYVKEQSDNEIIYSAAYTFNYEGTVYSLKSKLRPYEFLALMKADVIDKECNVCFCIMVPWLGCYCNCYADFFNFTVKATLNNTEKKKDFNNVIYTKFNADPFMHVSQDGPVYSGSKYSKFLIGWDPTGPEYSFRGYKITTGNTTYIDDNQQAQGFYISPTNGY